MLRAESLSRAPRCSTDVCRKSIPRAYLELLGMQGKGASVWCPTWMQWDWQWGPERGTQSLGEGRGGAEEAGHAQDCTS